jgi:hypothetical protein
MSAYESSPAISETASEQALRDRSAPDAFRLLDWTKLDAAPSSMDVTRLSGIGGRDGSARLAILVNTPRMLRAANVFAEQAGMHGAQVRVFVDSGEALAWLYRDVSSAVLGPNWVGSRPLKQA